MLCQTENKTFHTYNMPWADETECGFETWCQQGKCVKRGKNKQIDGGWGEWQM